VNGISGNPVESGELNEETFLKLLTTQLQNQDPLEPADDVEFIQQMATFASLEQERMINSNLGVIQLYQSSINNSNALNIVGKEVKMLDNALPHEEGQSHTIYYDSDSQAQKVHISVVDQNGKEVFTQSQLGASDGEQAFTWYGVDNDGNDVPAGDYSVRVHLEDTEGTKHLAATYQNQTVRGISYENNSIVLLVGDRKVPIENVIEVYEPGGAAGGGDSGESESAGPGGFKTALSQPYYQPYQVIAGGR
jgi:flagellar basal-body rod modification protein FlgD